MDESLKYHFSSICLFLLNYKIKKSSDSNSACALFFAYLCSCVLWLLHFCSRDKTKDLFLTCIHTTQSNSHGKYKILQKKCLYKSPVNLYWIDLLTRRNRAIHSFALCWLRLNRQHVRLLARELKWGERGGGVLNSNSNNEKRMLCAAL